MLRVCTFLAPSMQQESTIFMLSLYCRQPSFFCFLSLPSIRTPVVATQRCVLAYTHSMNRGDKRPLDMNGEDAAIGDKRQRGLVASGILEAVKQDSLQKLCSTLEPFLRRVVGEEVERALARWAPSATPPRLGGRSSPKRIQGSNAETLRLQFRSKLALPLFTGSKVEGEGGSGVHVVLLDADTGLVKSHGLEANAKLEVVVLEGDFSIDEERDWTQDEFEQNVVRERDGKRPLLTGELSVVLKEGVGTVGDLTFTDNSSWIRSRKFRLGVKLASGQVEGQRIREAKTEAFTVKDHRGELYKKHYPPALHDEVWRLDRIGKDGAFHKRLNQSGIFTVEDFLRLVVMDPQKLRNYLGSGMSNKMWEGTVDHAKTCVLNGKLHVYYADEKQNIGVIFNNIFQLMGLIADEQYMSVDLLSDSEKIYVDKLVKVAYENWGNVVEYDGEALIGVRPHSLSGINARTEDPGQSAHRGVQPLAVANLPLLPASAALQAGIAIDTRPNSAATLVEMSLFPGASAVGGLWEREGEEGWEEEIRAAAGQLLASDDMQLDLQQLVGMLGGGQEVEGLDLLLATPAADRASGSQRRARVSWFKIKAALRWGIFIRKQAAQRRASVEEVVEEEEETWGS